LRRKKHPTALALSANVLLQQSRMAEAERRLAQAMKLKKANSDVYIGKVMLFRLQGDYPKAKAAALVAKAKFPKDNNVQFIASTYDKQDKPVEPPLQLKNSKAESLDPESQLLRMQSLLLGSRHLEALASCDAMITRQPQDPLGYICRGLVHLANQRTADALLDSDTAVSKADNGATRLFRAAVKLAMQDFEAAKVDATMALTERYQMCDAYILRSIANEGLKNSRLAAADLEQALQLADPVLAPRISQQLGVLKSRYGESNLSKMDEEYPQK
jgi:hypothetical protein